MFEGIAGGIAGAMLEYANQKNLGWRKVFFYPFFTFTLFMVVVLHLFFPTSGGIAVDLLLAISFGIFSGLLMLCFRYYAKTRKQKHLNP